MKQPSCVKTQLDGNKITYTIEKELGVELVGDVKVKIEANLEEEPWDDIVEDSLSEEEIKDDFIHEEPVI